MRNPQTPSAQGAPGELGNTRGGVAPRAHAACEGLCQMSLGLEAQPPELRAGAQGPVLVRLESLFPAVKAAWRWGTPIAGPGRRHPASAGAPHPQGSRLLSRAPTYPSTGICRDTVSAMEAWCLEKQDGSKCPNPGHWSSATGPGSTGEKVT